MRLWHPILLVLSVVLCAKPTVANNAIFNWLNAADPTYGTLVSDEKDSVACTTSGVQLTCSPGVTFTTGDVNKTVILGYAGSGHYAFVTTFANFISSSSMDLAAAPYNTLPLYPITQLGQTTATGAGYKIGDTVCLNFGSGCSVATGTVNAVIAVNLPTLAAPGSSSSAYAGVTCNVTANGNGTSADGDPLAGAYVKVNVTLSSTSPYGIATINSLYTYPIYLADMATQSAEPVTGAYQCPGLTGAKLNFVGTFGAYNIKPINLAGFAPASTTCNGGPFSVTPVTSSGSGATENCVEITANVRWGTDNFSVFQAVANAASTLAQKHTPACIYVPSGNYLTSVINTPINGFGCAFGDSIGHTNFFLVPNVAGDLFGVLDSGESGSTQNLGGTLTFSDYSNGNFGEGGFRDFSCYGERDSSAVQNCLMYYGRDEWQIDSNIWCFWLRGRCIGVGADTNGKGSLDESRLYNIRADTSGDSPGASSPGVPSIDISAVSNAIHGTSGPNGVELYGARVYHSFGPGIEVSSCTLADQAHVIKLYGGHIEGSGMDGSAGGADLLLLGNNNCGSKVFPTSSGGGATVNGQPSPGISATSVVGISLTNPIAGYACVHIEGINSSNGQINLEGGDCSSTGEALGGGLWVDAGSNSAFSFVRNSANDYQLRAVSTSSYSGLVGSGLFYNGLGLGSEFGITTLLEAALQPTGASPMSFPLYATSPGHPTPLTYVMTGSATDNTTGSLSIVGTGIGSFDVGNGFPQAGTSFAIHGACNFNTAGTVGNFTLAFKVGGKVIAQATAADLLASATNAPLEFDEKFTYRAVGTSATLQPSGYFTYKNGANTYGRQALDNGGSLVTGISTNTLSGTYADVTTTWASSGNSITCFYLTLGALN